MSISSIRLGLSVGPGLPDPAPARIMRALRAVEVTQTDTAPCSFQLTFQADQTAQGDFQIAEDDLLRPFRRVRVQVIVDGAPSTLIDGFITRHQYTPGNGPSPSAFVVSGEDVSVKMDLVSYPLEYPAMEDSVIVAAVLAKWVALGIVPLIVPMPTSAVPFSFVPQQNGTDRAYVHHLAQRNGNVFYVTPGPEPFTNVAYWGPRPGARCPPPSSTPPWGPPPRSRPSRPSTTPSPRSPRRGSRWRHRKIPTCRCPSFPRSARACRRWRPARR
jgi:hypothetical protein